MNVIVKSLKLKCEVSHVQRDRELKLLQDIKVIVDVADGSSIKSKMNRKDESQCYNAKI